MSVIESIVRDLHELPIPKLVEVARYVHGLNPGGFGIFGGAVLFGGFGYIYGSGDLANWTGDPDLEPIPIPDLLEELGKEAYDIALDLGFK